MSAVSRDNAGLQLKPKLTFSCKASHRLVSKSLSSASVEVAEIQVPVRYPSISRVRALAAFVPWN